MHGRASEAGSAFRQANAAGGQANARVQRRFPAAASGHRRGFTRASLLPALPKTILRRGRNLPAPSSALPICCCASTDERPRAVLVAWDTLEVPTYRHEKFPATKHGGPNSMTLLEQGISRAGRWGPLACPTPQAQREALIAVEAQQHIGKAEDGAGRFAAPPQDCFRQGV